MSASDYTYLRRMRHARQPPCNQPTVVVSCVPPTNYIQSGYVNCDRPPAPCHQHPPPYYHPPAPCYPPPAHHYHPPAPQYPPPAPCSCETPYYQEPVQYHHNNAVVPCSNSAGAPCYKNAIIPCPPPPPAEVPVVGAGDIYSTTMNLYLITPTRCGTVNFTIDCGMSYVHGTKVSCESMDASCNSFEGTVYSYNNFSGEITIYEIKHINGAFNRPARYSVMIMSASKEFNILRDRINALYQEVFNIDLSEPACGGGGGNVPTQAQATLVVNLFKYFFNIDITSTDSNYALTEAYLTTKLAYLYQYFFNVNISTNTSFNPNGNSVSLSTLNAKISQLYLYFFNNDLSTGNITII